MESFHAQFGYRIGYDHFRKSHTALKRLRSYGYETVRKYKLFKPCTALKSKVVYCDKR